MVRVRTRVAHQQGFAHVSWEWTGLVQPVRERLQEGPFVRAVFCDRRSNHTNPRVLQLQIGGLQVEAVETLSFFEFRFQLKEALRALLQILVALVRSSCGFLGLKSLCRPKHLDEFSLENRHFKRGPARIAQVWLIWLIY